MRRKPEPEKPVLTGVKYVRYCPCRTSYGYPGMLTMSASAAAQSAVTTQPAIMDRQREAVLALSACPAFVADKAAVCVREKSGYSCSSISAAGGS
jgi:hypothetical protein